jgi:hypothetical protein
MAGTRSELKNCERKVVEKESKIYGCNKIKRAVFAALGEIVEETSDLYQTEGKPLPPPTAGKDYANRMLQLA